MVAVSILIEHEVTGAIALADVNCEASREAIDRLKRSRIRMITITGDSRTVAEADVGIAIGAGTIVAMDTADIQVSSDARDVARIVDLAPKTYRKMVQILWWAAGYNIVAIPPAAGVLAWTSFVLSPAIGALLMSVSTVIVAINAPMLGRGHDEPA